MRAPTARMRTSNAAVSWRNKERARMELRMRCALQLVPERVGNSLPEQSAATSARLPLEMHRLRSGWEQLTIHRSCRKRGLGLSGPIPQPLRIGMRVPAILEQLNKQRFY